MSEVILDSSVKRPECTHRDLTSLKPAVLEHCRSARYLFPVARGQSDHTEVDIRNDMLSTPQIAFSKVDISSPSDL